MKVINQYNQVISEYDLTKGKLVEGKLVQDGIIEKVQIYVPDSSIYNRPCKVSTSVSAKIKKLKAQLAATDYKVIKCSEYQLLGEPMPYDVVALHAERQAIRDKINELEAQLCQS